MEENIAYIRKSGEISFVRKGEDFAYDCIDTGMLSCTFLDRIGEKIFVIKDETLAVFKGNFFNSEFEKIQEIDLHGSDASCSVYCYLKILNEKFLLTGGLDGNINLWDIQKEKFNEPTQSFSCGEEVYGLSFFENEGHVVSVNYCEPNEDCADNICIHDLSTGKLIRWISGHKVSVNCCEKSKDERLLLTGDSNGLLKLWDRSSSFKNVGIVDDGGFLDFIVCVSEHYFVTSDFHPSMRCWDFRKLNEFIDEIDEKEVLKLYNMKSEENCICSVLYDSFNDQSEILITEINGGKFSNHPKKSVVVKESRGNKVYDCCAFNESLVSELRMHGKDIEERNEYMKENSEGFQHFHLHFPQKDEDSEERKWIHFPKVFGFII